MKTRRLDDIDEIDALDLIKIDTQGAEAIIMSNGAKKLANVVAAITEIRFFPMYEDEPPLTIRLNYCVGSGCISIRSFLRNRRWSRVRGGGN